MCEKSCERVSAKMSLNIAVGLLGGCFATILNPRELTCHARVGMDLQVDGGRMEWTLGALPTVVLQELAVLLGQFLRVAHGVLLPCFQASCVIETTRQKGCTFGFLQLHRKGIEQVDFPGRPSRFTRDRKIIKALFIHRSIFLAFESSEKNPHKSAFSH